MFEKILVANRGEIAVRIIRACKELISGLSRSIQKRMSIRCHVQLADEAICIGKAAANESYLRIDRLISAPKLPMSMPFTPATGFWRECSFCRRVPELQHPVHWTPVHAR